MEAMPYLGASSIKLMGNKTMEYTKEELTDMLLNGMEQFFEECDDVLEFGKVCTTGAPDVVSQTNVLMVGVFADWKRLVGEAIIYGMELKRFPEIALAGNSKVDNFDLILEKCTEISVGCYIFDIANEDLFRFAEGMGGWTKTNIDVLTQNIRTEAVSAMN